MYEDKDYNGKKYYDDKCQRKPYVKVWVECGKECQCLCGKLWGIECKCCNKNIMILKTKCGKKVYINFDKISYWKYCDGWD